MKSARDIEQSIKKLAVESSDRIHDRILEKLLRKLDKSKRQATVEQANMWRIIMKSPITKIAAAAVILIGLAFVLHNGSVDIASNVYAQMSENIRKMPWVHIITTGTHEGKEVELKQWFSDEEQVIALKRPDGELGFSDYKKGRRYIYDPNTQLITISFISQSDYTKNAIPLQNSPNIF